MASRVTYDLANTIFAVGVVGFYFSDWLINEGPGELLVLSESPVGIQT